MTVARILVLFTAVAASAAANATTIGRSGGFVSFDSIAMNANVIAVIELTAGQLREGRMPAVVYHFKLAMQVEGHLQDGVCLEGPRGLRIGERYLVFVERLRAPVAAGGTDSCVVVGTLGDTVPRAMQVVIGPSGAEYAKLDSEKIAYPIFDGIMPLHQDVYRGEERSTLVIGSWAPIASVLTYVAGVRSRLGEQ